MEKDPELSKELLSELGKELKSTNDIFKNLSKTTKELVKEFQFADENFKRVAKKMTKQIDEMKEEFSDLAFDMQKSYAAAIKRIKEELKKLRSSIPKR